MSDRGMKKWNAYRSLPEQDPALLNAVNKTKLIEKPILSEDKMEEINNILVNYNNEILIFSIFKNNKIIKIVGNIKKIDVNNRKIYLFDKKIINLEDIIDISYQQ